MMIIVTNPGIIIDVVGSYLYEKEIMTENGIFVLGEPEMQLHDIIWAVHDGKNHGRSEGDEISRSSRLWWVVGAERCTVVCTFLSCTRVCARRWALTKPERSHCYPHY